MQVFGETLLWRLPTMKAVKIQLIKTQMQHMEKKMLRVTMKVNSAVMIIVILVKLPVKKHYQRRV